VFTFLTHPVHGDEAFYFSQMLSPAGCVCNCQR